MGYEYELAFEVKNRQELDELLRRVSGFDGYDTRYELYLFRRSSIGEMPDAHAKINENGLYVCNNGANGLSVLQDIRSAVSVLVPFYTFRDLSD
jgi:hypothetical protein